MHTHDFRVFVGLPTSFGRTAWVREDFVDDPTPHLHLSFPKMYCCDVCGEQGYEVPATGPINGG